MDEQSVTVVIATRDRKDELLRTTTRLRALPERPEVIVVDNGSADAEPVPDTVTIRMPRNLGAAARNIGVRAARTPYVAFSDDDSWWEPGALRRAVEVFDAHPRLGLIAARTEVGPQREPDPINDLLAASPLLDDDGLPGPPVLGFLACASVVRRQAFLEAGGFHPVLFFVGEEALLAMDLAARGWVCCHLDDVVAVHEPSAHRPAPQHRHRAELRNATLTTWLRRPLGTALSSTARLARSAVSSGDARAALGGTLVRLPQALRHREPLPGRVESAVRLLERSR